MKINPDNIKKLNKLELKWYNQMKAGGGVLYISGEPGSAKTAIFESMANKLNQYYIDMRLSQKDEAEVGNLPALSEDRRTFHYAVPEWAVIANDPNAFIKKDKNGKPVRKPYDGTLVVYEELNRANLYVRNAGLQLLQERKIGELFKFKDHVLMAATGNLGEEDGTEVEEFDAALNNRLIHVKHRLELSIWIKEYAKKNVHPIIVSFLDNYPAEFFKKAKEGQGAFATARSWSNLSKYITETYGMDAKIDDFFNDVKEFGINYVGQSITRFIRYLDEVSIITINDIVTRFDQVKDIVESFKKNRAKISELLQQLRALKANKFTKKQVDNIIKFFEYIPDDEKIPYLTHIFEHYMSGDTVKDEKKNINKLLVVYKDVVEKLYSFNK